MSGKGWGVAAAVVGGIWLLGANGTTGHSHFAAVRYAESKIGMPYEWGASGPGAFDCSGLAMMAEQAAGKSIPRTSQEQWASLPHVSRPKPGDLVFFAGGDGTMSSPGHVGIVVSARHHMMIDAPEPGTDVREESYAGWPDFVGFADPGGK
jgi:cell wall-associated NlpC family hydrolase